MSGGNKRKLCCAIAMLGKPKVIFIDEATTGIDPGNRRLIWKSIKEEGSQSAVVVTTHRMEEAELISDKLTIMVKGQFRCFGSVDDVKKKYGTEFDIILTLELDEIKSKLTD